MSSGKHRRKHDSMPVPKKLSAGSTEREVVGVIVTAREQETDERIVLHEPGRTRDALAVICGDLDLRDGDWKVLSISTPITIFRDLQGTRENSWTDAVGLPEHQMLADIGRRDLMDPALYPRDLSQLGRAGGLWGKETPRVYGDEAA